MREEVKKTRKCVGETVKKFFGRLRLVLSALILKKVTSK